MKSVRCLLLLQFYVLSLASKPRSVNLALETTFEFNNKQDVAVIERVRKFLDTIENAVDKKLAIRLGDDETRYEFTDFLRDLIATISTYDDDNLKAVFKVLNDEIHNYRYRGSRFNEIMDNDNLRYRVVDILRKTNEAPVQFLRNQLKKNLNALQRKSIDKQNTSFLNFLNIIYKRKSSETLKQTVENLRLYGKRSAESGFNLRDIIKAAVKTLVYDKYSNLDENVRRDVKTWLETVAKSSNFKLNKQSHKNPDEKKTRTDRMKRLRGSSPRMYTFVTLYPEEIHFEMKSFEHRTLRTPKPAWSERTVPDKNYFYLIKAIPPAVRSKGEVGDRERSKLNSSSTSLEDDWRTHRREITSALWLARHQKEKPFSKLPKKTPQKSIKEFLSSSSKSDKWLRRADQYNGNDETASSNYLERIKRLETELNKMKMELTAKISSISNKLAADVNKTIDEYSDYGDQDGEIYLKDSNSTQAVTAEVEDTKPPEEVTSETAKTDAVFRSRVNDSQDRNDTTKANETQTTEVSIKELNVHNLTFRAVMESNEINQTNDTTTAVVKSYGTKNFNTSPAETVTVAIAKEDAVKVSNGKNSITVQPDKVVSANTTIATDASSNTTISNL